MLLLMLYDSRQTTGEVILLYTLSTHLQKECLRTGTSALVGQSESRCLGKMEVHNVSVYSSQPSPSPILPLAGAFVCGDLAPVCRSRGRGRKVGCER